MNNSDRKSKTKGYEKCVQCGRIEKDSFKPCSRCFCLVSISLEKV